jgi:hypothetical protein
MIRPGHLKAVQDIDIFFANVIYYILLYNNYIYLYTSVITDNYNVLTLAVSGIAISYGLDELHVVHTGSVVHPTSYPMGTVGSFPGSKAAGS